MIQIYIALRTPEDQSGTIAVRSDQAELLSPRPFLVPRASLVIQPDVHVGQLSSIVPFFVKEVIPMAGASLADVREYGRYGFIVLETADGESTPRKELTLHGGEADEKGVLRPATTALRISNTDMRELVRILNQFGKQEVVVECTNLASYSLVSTSAEQVAVDRPHFRFRTLPGWIAAAVPFVAAGSSYAQCDQYDSGTSFSAVDFGYLLIDEGGYLLNGYVPDNNSGVTIAGGLDLGLQTSSALLQMGFSQSQVNAWAPYLATSPSQPLIGAAARAALAKYPLSLTQAAAAQINTTYYTWVSNTVGAAYNAAVKSLGKLPGVTFSSLPAAWQTAMADMYLIDPGFVNTACFTQMASGEWSTAVASLQTFNGPTESVSERAKSNGDYLSTKMTGLPT